MERKALGDGFAGVATTAADLALLRAHEPVVRFTEGELFLPTAAAPYVERLGRLGREHRDRSLQLRFVTGPPARAALRRWRREERPRLRGSGRFASVGILTRTIDSVWRTPLLVRGRVPGGLVVAADLAVREHLEPGRCAYHGRVVRVGGYTVLQYWLFYVFNDWRSTFAGVNDHEADWELVCVYLADDAEGRLVPGWVAASSHDHAGDELRRRWDDPRLVRQGDHPVVFVGAGSHSMAFGPDDYVVSVTLPALRRVVDVATRVWRTVAPWSRAKPNPGAFALPFLDYKRGDGTAVGPNQQPRGTSWSSTRPSPGSATTKASGGWTPATPSAASAPRRAPVTTEEERCAAAGRTPSAGPACRRCRRMRRTTSPSSKHT
jgi:hypothetical protein